MSHYKPYPAYKDSGVEWLGEVPEGWEMCAIKRMTRLITDGAHISPETDGGVYNFISTKDIGDSGIDFEGCLKTSPSSYEYLVRTGCQPLQGDVLFSKDGTIGRTTVIKEQHQFVVASSLIIIRPDNTVLDSTFLQYLCQSFVVTQQVDGFIKGAGLPRLSIQNLLKVLGVFPQLEGQQTITAFLDRETAKIDTLISKQEKLIELLKEKRQAVISHAVTKGLNPKAKMKDSGVEWLGEVPEHWGAGRLRYICQCLDGQRIPLNAAQRFDRLGDIPYWGANSIVDYVDESLFDEDLVLLGEDGAPFFEPSKPVAFFSQGKVWPNNHVHVLRPVIRGTGKFIAHVLNVTDYAHFIDGSTRDKLTQGSMKDIPIPQPPLPEQSAITAFLDRETAKIDTLISKSEKAIELQKEHRTALISASVTGKIDVRGAT